MAKIKKPIKKAQNGAATADSTAYFRNQRANNLRSAKSLLGLEMTTGKNQGSDRAFSRAEKSLDDELRQKNKGKAGYDKNGYPLKKKKMGGAIKKAKSGGSFPDLNKDGKITKADVLVGRGVIKAKKGAALKKQAAVAIAMKKAGKAPKKMQYGGEAASMVPPTMKKGGKMKKAQSGASFKNITDMFGRTGGFDGGMRNQMAASILKKKTQKPQAGGSSFLSKPTMKKGGATKKCKYGCK